MDRELRASFEKVARRAPVDAVVSGRVGEPFVLELTDGVHRVIAKSERALETALKRPLTAEYLREQVGRLGTTCFELRGLEMKLDGAVIVPVSVINDVRRDAASRLEEARRGNPNYEVRPGALSRLRNDAFAGEEVTASSLVVLCRSLDQLRAALDEGIAHVECDFEDIKKYREAVALARERKAWIALAPPRIHKPDEGGIAKLVASCAPDAVLARSTAHLALFPGALIGDFSLNIANDLTADLFLSKGLVRFVPSYDLNSAQLEALLSRVDATRAEVVIHQQMPMFHMEHCVIAMALSTGHTAADCGRPCDRHRLSLRDRTGREHPLKADVGCRNTIYNAVPQSASQYVERMRELGVRWFRIELMNQEAAEAARVVRAYGDLVAGRRDGETLWREVKASNEFGVTRGPLGRGE